MEWLYMTISAVAWFAGLIAGAWLESRRTKAPRPEPVYAVRSRWLDSEES